MKPKSLFKLFSRFILPVIILILGQSLLAQTCTDNTGPSGYSKNDL